MSGISPCLRISVVSLIFLASCLPAAAQTAASPPTADASHAAGWVVIPVDEYQGLRARAFPAERTPEPPVDATLSSVDYDLHVLGDLATGRASLTIDVLKDGWVRVPVPAGLLVREARLDGKLVSLVPGGFGKGENQPTVILPHAGRAVLLLEIALPVNASAGEERISLPSTSSGVTRAHVQVPRTGVDVKLSGGLLAEKSETAGESLWVAYARGNEPLTFTWRRKLEAVQLDGEVFSKAAAKVPLTSGLTILNARQEGKALPLQEEGSTSVAVLPGASEFSVALETGLPLVIEAGRASFSLPVPAAGSVRLSLAIPGDHSIIRISPGLITSRRSEKGQTVVEATLAPGQPALIWWATGIAQAPVVKHEVRFLSDVKTLVTINDEELRIAALCDINVVQGDPTQFVLEMPAGYEITGVSGSTVDSSEIENGRLVVRLNSSAPRNHELLISMERPLSGTKADAPFLSFKDAQRETGEVLVEGTGAMELTASEGGGLKRMDVKEVNPYLRSLSRYPLEAAFRYHRQPAETPTLALDWTRFPDSSVLAAVAEHAVVTTLVTVEGRTLTEVKLTVKNQAQPFLKVNLPAGATIVSADVAGEKVKPVQGPDGNRVPLLRAGFRPNGPYEVSFVFMLAGVPFAKKGGSELALPSMDVPISLLEWELFLPEQYKVKDFGGDVIAANLLEERYSKWLNEDVRYLVPDESKSGFFHTPKSGLTPSSNAGLGAGVQPGQLEGYVVDPAGAVIPGVQIKITSLETGVMRMATTDSSGHWTVFNMPAGRLKMEASASGFQPVQANATYDDSRGGRYDLRLAVGNTSETVTVSAEAMPVEGKNSSARKDRDRKKQEAIAQNGASDNVLNLQKRVAGVLPVRIDVPRAGNSYRFARTLVLDEETRVTFNYKTSEKR